MATFWFEGKPYRSLNVFCQQHNINQTRLNYLRSQKGMTLEESIHHELEVGEDNNREVTYNGVVYHSFHEASKKLGIHYSNAISHASRYGLTKQQLLDYCMNTGKYREDKNNESK